MSSVHRDASRPSATESVHQRMQAYYVCVQQEESILHVVRGWYQGDNRFAFDMFQKAAGLGLSLRTQDFYALSGRGYSFQMVLSWYNQFYERINEFATFRTERHLWPLPQQLLLYFQRNGGVNAKAFVREFMRLFYAAIPEQHRRLCSGNLGPLEMHRVPAKPDSMVFFFGPHMVSGSPVRRMAVYVHSETEHTAEAILNDFPTYEDRVRSMQIPPNAQGKTRSDLVDRYLKRTRGDWGWMENDGLAEEVRLSLLSDRESIRRAPLVAPPDNETVSQMQASIEANSCYVAEGVLGSLSGLKFCAAGFERHVLECLVIVLDCALAEQEALRARLLDWVCKYNGGAGALLRCPDNPKLHEKELKARLRNAGMPSGTLRDFAQNVLLRGVRKPESASWQRFSDPLSTFRWTADPDIGSKKLLRTPEEAIAELRPAPTTESVGDGPLARLDGNMANPKDLWQLVRNIGGGNASAALRARLFAEGRIAHPHIGAWVSAQKPWCPPLSNPVGSWQNVYQVLVQGMFDTHYMPAHAAVRHALKPMIEQMWHATSRIPFTKVLFTPERLNLRELPNGGSMLQWHIDQDALAPALAPEQAPECADARPCKRARAASRRK